MGRRDLQQLRRAARREAQSAMLISPRFRGEDRVSITESKAWKQRGRAGFLKKKR
jgi:hypothetical protein